MNNFFKAISLIAAVCVAAGCGGSVVAETTAGAGIQAETSTVSETTTAAESVSAEIEELEVDHVDEFDCIYYKNPTEWTIEKIFEELTINGQKFDAPLTLEKLGSEYSYSTDDGAFYDEDTRTACVRLMLNDKSLAWAYLDDCDNINDTKNKQFNAILFSSDSTDEEYRDNSFISGLKVGSDVNDIVALVGTPIKVIGDKQWFSFGCYHNSNHYVTLDIIQNEEKVIYVAACFTYDQERKID